MAAPRKQLDLFVSGIGRSDGLNAPRVRVLCVSLRAVRASAVYACLVCVRRAK